MSKPKTATSATAPAGDPPPVDAGGSELPLQATGDGETEPTAASTGASQAEVAAAIKAAVDEALATAEKTFAARLKAREEELDHEHRADTKAATEAHAEASRRLQNRIDTLNRIVEEQQADLAEAQAAAAAHASSDGSIVLSPTVKVKVVVGSAAFIIDGQRVDHVAGDTLTLDRATAEKAKERGSVEFLSA